MGIYMYGLNLTKKEKLIFDRVKRTILIAEMIGEVKGNDIRNLFHYMLKHDGDEIVLIDDDSELYSDIHIEKEVNLAEYYKTEWEKKL